MNFLAHLHIADATQTNFAGAIAGDFVKGPLPDQLTDFDLGVALHRGVDGYIDSHPLLLELKQQFPKPYRRTSGILLDMAFDHLLAKNWHHWHPSQLPQFTQFGYKRVLNDAALPKNARRTVTAMARGDWLSSYATEHGLSMAITGISRRLSRPQLLRGGEQALAELKPDIQQTFDKLYPQIIAFSRQHADALALTQQS